MIYSTMVRTNKFDISPNSGVGRNPSFFAAAIGGAAATRECIDGGELGIFCVEINGAGIASTEGGRGGNAVEPLTGVENGARESVRVAGLFVGIDNLLQLKGFRECD